MYRLKLIVAESAEQLEIKVNSWPPEDPDSDAPVLLWNVTGPLTVIDGKFYQWIREGG